MSVAGNQRETALGSLFDYDYYLKYVDNIFERLGLIELKEVEQPELERLAPEAL